MRLPAVVFLSATAILAQPKCETGAPCYSADGIVNAASFVRGALAPNTIAAIFGSNLSYATRALGPGDVQGGRLPTNLAGVTVRVGPVLAPLYYVSPTQINLLIPGNLDLGQHEVRVVRDGWAGPGVKVNLLDAAPALFLLDPQTVVASHDDFSVVTPDSPGRADRFLILWATGLGPTSDPTAAYDLIPVKAALIKRLPDLRVLINNLAVDPGKITYAGIAPYLAGVYQINLKLPNDVPSDPEIRLSVGDQVSASGVRAPVRPSE